MKMLASENRGGHTPRDAGSQQKLQEARDSPGASRGVSALLAPQFQSNDSGHQPPEPRENSVCCSKPQVWDYLLQQLQETNTSENGFSAGHQLCQPRVPSLRL